MASVGTWIWSPEYDDYYMVLEDGIQGTPTYKWASQTGMDNLSQPISNTTTAGDDRNFRATFGSVQVAAPQLCSSSPLSNFIPGTPESGHYDQLDSRYFMRTGGDARSFWKVGRVFAMLYTEPAGNAARMNELNDAFSIVRFGETVYSQIRRFVVVSVRRQFVYALSIVTYRGQGVNKRGVDPHEHAIMYASGQAPCYIDGEYEKGMTKDPIEMTPSNETIPLARESRIRFGKVYAIEWNVKVREIGMVAPKDTEKLLEYWRQEEHI